MDPRLAFTRVNPSETADVFLDSKLEGGDLDKFKGMPLEVFSENSSNDGGDDGTMDGDHPL